MARSRRPRKPAAIERLEHGDEILGQHGFLLPRRRGLGVADAGEHGGDMPVLAVERLAALGIIPGQRREPALDRRHRVRLLVGRRRAGGAGGDVEADDLRIRGQEREVLAPAQARKMPPVGGVGAPGVGRACCLDIVAGAIGERLEMSRQADRRLCGDIDDGRQRGRGGRWGILGVDLIGLRARLGICCILEENER